MRDIKKKRSSSPQLSTNSLKKNRAFDLKYRGSSNETISKKLKINSSTLATYFSREWKSDYEKFELEQNNYILKWSRQSLIRSLNKASNTLVVLLDSSDDKIRLRASVELLDRYLPRLVEKQIARDPVEALLEEYGLMKDGEIIDDEESSNSSM